MKFVFLTIVLFLCSLGVLSAQTPTWSENVAGILYKNCTSCHHTGGIAPFPLIAYNDAATRRAIIQYMVEEKLMPPYPADVTYRRYAHQRALKDEDLQTIVSWASNGAPEGDPSKAPPPPQYTNGPKLQQADAVFTMPEYVSTAASQDVYRCFSMKSDFTEDKFISAIEVLPGNPAIVHHVLVFRDTSSVTDLRDAQDPGPGYASFGGVGSQTAVLLAAYAPGIEPFFFPQGFGLRVPKNARIIFQVHYPEGTAGQTDQTTVRVKFAQGGAFREIGADAVLNQLNITDGPMVIPPNTVKTFHQKYKTPLDASAMTVMPHMHLLGKSTKVYAVTPAQDTIPLVRIPDWDFHWQLAYTFEHLVHIPRNSSVESEVTYDNTTNNHHNPNNPPKEVRYGESTTDEMMLTYFYYLLYMPGDENIRLDNTGPTASVNDRHRPGEYEMILYPNPAVSEDVTLRVRGGKSEYATIRLFDALGRNVGAVYDGPLSGEQMNIRVHARNLAPGRYYVRMTTATRTEAKMLSVR